MLLVLKRKERIRAVFGGVVLLIIQFRERQLALEAPLSTKTGKVGAVQNGMCEMYDFLITSET